MKPNPNRIFPEIVERYQLLEITKGIFTNYQKRSFAEAKEYHGLRFARMLGIQNMREQCFLTAAAQNIKRLAMA
ncbi:MAG: transposase [Clostridia bacterium]|nr:transposase [Clostridia bacterium]